MNTPDQEFLTWLKHNIRTKGRPVNNPIERALGPIEHFAERELHDAEHGISRIIHPRHYHQQQDTSTPEGTPVTSIMTSVSDAVAEGVKNIEGWAGDLKAKLPEVAAFAAKHESILTELEALGETVLPPEAITGIVSLIQMGGKVAAAAAGAVSAPATTAVTAATTPAAPAA